MTVILVLGTFLVFILIDFFLNRKQLQPSSQETIETTPQTLLSSASIEGILVPDQLRYHAGHTWFSEERPDLAKVGLDALAVRQLGHAEKIEIPKMGRWVRQGQKAFTVVSGSQTFDWVSPAEGEVTEVNPEVLRDPSLLVTDPYGRGWLAKIRMPDPELVERNLLPRAIVRTWMRDEIRQFRASRPVTQVKAVNEH